MSSKKTLSAIKIAVAPSPACTSVNTDSARSSQLLSSTCASGGAKTRIGVSSLVDGYRDRPRFRRVLDQRERPGQLQQMCFPPAFRPVAVPALAGALVRHSKQLPGVLRPAVGILLETGEDELIELLRNRQLRALRRRDGR